MLFGAAVARSETGKVDIGKCLKYTLLQSRVNILLGKMLLYRLGRQKRLLDIEFVGDTTPQGFIDFFIKLLVVAVVQVTLGITEPFLGEFHSALQFQRGLVALYRLLAAYKQDDDASGYYRQNEHYPERCRCVTIVVCGVKMGFLADVMYVAVELLDIASRGG